MMKKKEIIMICFVLLITAISLFAILQTSGNNSNNNVSNTKIEGSTNIAKESGGSKTPTVTNNSNSSTNNDKTQNTDNSKSNSNNSSSDVDADDEPRDDENSSDTLSANETYTVYEVKKGDTLSNITKEYEDVCPVSILSKAILKANKLTKANEIKEGMKINIPDRYTSGSSYSVKSGDSLYTIAKSAFQDIDITKAINQIKTDNFLSNDSIKVGEKLFITTTFTSTTSVSSTTDFEKDETQSTNNVPVSDKELVTYTLKDGETLSTITKKYEKYCPSSISSKTILKVSGISDAKDVKVGSTIKIPEKYLTNGEKYTVKSGDTLSSIATSHFTDMTVNNAIDKIKSDNYMSSYNVKLGEQLFITALSLDNEEKSN